MPPTADTHLKLEIDGQSWPLQHGDVIGRLGTVGGDALRQYDVLSRKHLLVEQDSGRWTLTLLPKVRNETLCNGVPMTTATPVAVEDGCEIQVDTLTLRLRFEAPVAIAGHPVPLVTLDKQLHVTWRNHAATQLLRHDLASGTDFLQFLEPGAGLRVRYALMSLREGAELEECRVASHTGDGLPWIALRAAHSNGQLLLALRDITQERQDHLSVKQVAERLEERVGALTTLLTAKPFVEGDLAAALPLLVQDAAELMDETQVSAWLPAVPSRKREKPSDFVCRAIAGGAHGSIGMKATLAALPKRGEVSPGLLATLQQANLLDSDASSTWIEPLDQGLLVFRRGDARGWLEPETRLTSLAAALGKQLFANVQRREAMETLQSREAALSAELGEAAEYVEKRLPAVAMKGQVQVDWIYQPCGRLGGDTFGYEWLDEHRFAIYIADVVGHGSRAALHALSVSQTLKLLLARGAEEDPAAWLASLNKEFPMHAHEGLLWTMWCGLYDGRKRTLRHASGGHPPALLVHGGKIEELCSAGPVLGAMEDAEYQSASMKIPTDAKLFLFTDGVYEFPMAGGEAGTLADFTDAVSEAAGMKQGECAFLKTRAAGLCAAPDFPDDFTIVRARFAR